MSSGLGGGGEETEVAVDDKTEDVSLQLSVPGASCLEDVAFSKSVKMKGHQWRIMVVHRELNSKDVMGAYIQRVGNKSSGNQTGNWSIVINASISLVNQFDPEKSYTKDFRHQYTHSSTDWGYSNFLRWREVLNPNRGFVKDDTIIVHARLVYPGPNARPDPTPSSSQSHSTSAHFSQPHHSHSHTPSSLSRSSSSSSSYPGNSRVAQPPIPPLTHPSSQDSMSDSNSQLTPSSTSVLPPEMVSFLSCPYCNEQYEPEGQKSPNTLHCGHSFCLSCLEKILMKEEGGRQRLACPTCSRDHSVDPAISSRPWFPNLSVAQLVTTVLSKAKHFCPVHQHDRNYYCFKDKSLVCIYCAYHGEHAGHPCQPVSEARQVVRDELRPLRVRAQGRVSEAERRLQLMRDEGEMVRTQALSAAKNVEEYYASMEAGLRRQRDLLLNDLQTHATCLHGSIETHIVELERHHSKARRCLEEYDKWKAMPAREALSNVSTITQTLQMTASASLPLSSARQGGGGGSGGLRITVQLPSSTPLSSLGPLGHVTVTCPPSSSQRVGLTPGDRPHTEQVQGGWVTAESAANGGGGRREEEGEGEEGPKNQRSLEEEEPVNDSVMDTQEEEEEGGQEEDLTRGGVAKRKPLVIDSSPDFELQSKKRKI